VVVQRHARATVVLKVYRTPPWLRWRTLLTAARAAREWSNLVRVRGAGVPCVEPLGWDERRVLGCVRESGLLTRFVPDAPSLKDWLSGGARPRERSAMCEELGRLVRRLHDAGVLGCRMSPRNFLVVGGRELMLLDLPAAVPFRRGIAHTARASIDLWDAALSPGRRRQLSAPDRLRILVGYCGGDRRSAATTWRALAGRPRAWNRVQKALLVGVCSYVAFPLVRMLARSERLVPARDLTL
jgi:hypothetical protein